MTSILILPLSFLLSTSAFALTTVPTHLADLDGQARTIVMKKFIETCNIPGKQSYYSNFKSSVGKYGAQFGDFDFKADIWSSNNRKFQCENNNLRVEADAQGMAKLDPEDLIQYTECKEVPPVDTLAQ